ncbi:MAG: hypothetical protein WBX11_09880 [Thiobacillaceae bacterium]|jgi:hypothetical protein
MKHRVFTLLLGIAVFHLAASADSEPTAADNPAGAGRSDFMQMDYQKSMKMEEPMPTGMAKPGMKKGEVKANAEKRETEIEKMMQENMK